MKKNYQNLIDKYCNIWNNSLKELQLACDADMKDFLNDKNIGFKWSHLVQQEIEMWIRQCCGDVVEWTEVPLDDFEFIIKRRGFTPRMTNILKSILVDIGIGDNLKDM